jgi:hypothetical protein
MTTATVTDYQVLCEQGRTAAAVMDTGRWIIGDLACEIETVYGAHLIDDFAREVNVGKASVKAYRTVCRFYTPATRVAFLEVNPRITYTHMRHAMRLETVDAAYAFLNEASANGYTTDEAAHHIAELVGKATQSKVFDKVVSIKTDGDNVTFPCDAVLVEGVRYRFVVYEVSSDENA